MLWWILGTWHGTTRLPGTGTTITTDTATVITPPSGGTTGTTGDGVGMTLGDMAGTGMTEPGIPGAGDGVGMTHGTIADTMAGTTHHTDIIVGMTEAIMDTVLITPAEAAWEQEAAWVAQPESLQEATPTGLLAAHTAEPLPLVMQEATPTQGDLFPEAMQPVTAM